MPDAIEQLREKFKAICLCLDSPHPHHTAAQDNGAAHVEVVAGIYSYVITERGTEVARRRSANPDEVLYWLTSDVAFGIASQFELAHRVKGQDTRRLLFSKQLELMARVDAQWGARKQLELQAILAKHPYVDGVDG